MIQDKIWYAHSLTVKETKDSFAVLKLEDYNKIVDELRNKIMIDIDFYIQELAFIIEGKVTEGDCKLMLKLYKKLKSKINNKGDE